MNNEEKIIIKEETMDEALETLEDFVSELKLDEKNYHVFMAVLRNRLDHHAGRMQELGIGWAQIDEV